MESFFGPWDLGRLLSDTFNIYFKHFLRFIAIAAMVTILLTALAISFFYIFGWNEIVPLIPGLPNPSSYYNPITNITDTTDFTDFTDTSALLQSYVDFFTIPGMVAYAALFAGVAVVGNSLMEGALTHGTAQHFMRPQIDVWTAYSSAWKRIIRFILVNLLYVLAIGVLFLSLIGIPIAIYFAVRWIFAGPAVLFEDASIGQAFGRSGRLIEDNWWRAFGYGLLFVIIVSIISIMISFISYIGGSIAVIVTTPITIIGITLFYFGLRVEKEQYNIHRMQTDLESWDADKKPIYTAAPYARSTDISGNRFSEQEPEFCTKCGTRRPPNSNFCIRCGKPFDSNNTTPKPNDKPDKNDDNNDGPFIR